MPVPDPIDGNSPLRRASRRMARLTPVLLALSLAIAGAVGPRAAFASPAGPHDPFGNVERITANRDGSVHFVGWAADPDTIGNVSLLGLTDGKVVASRVTSIPRGRVTKTYHTGTTPGFDFSVAAPTSGVHTVCVAVPNIGPGVMRILTCVATPLGTTLTQAQRNARSPHGLVTSATATASTLRIAGWANEPDFLASRVVASVYIDGLLAKTVSTHRSTAAQLRAGAGFNGAFDITAPVSSGSHLGCVVLLNRGFGSDTTLGCSAVDTRGAAGTGVVRAPVANSAVVTEAKKHIGQRYVFGAAGPTTFDCSGLVIYSYRKAGLTTPRIAAGQFGAARLIPSSRAVAGDLVFYHDSFGSVYHVGIYLAPGDTVAAIDEQEGIAHQHIWDPSSATYGSLTHI